MKMLAAIVLIVASVAAEPPIIRVDHVIVAMPSVEETKRLHRIFTATLGLPTAWPVQDYGSFASGGVHLGNLNLELMVSPKAEPHTIVGLAFEPRDTGKAYEELRKRGLKVVEEASFLGPGSDGVKTELWRNAALPQLKNENVEMFLCKYDSKWIAPYAAHWQGAMAESRGGVAGVIGVSEIEIMLPQPQRRWLASLIEPENTAAFHPRLKIVDGRTFQVLSLVVKCRAPEKADGVLPEKLAVKFSR